MKANDPSNMPAAELPITVGKIEHAAFMQAIDLIARCHASARSADRPINAKLFGVSGVGKTSAFELYTERHPASRTDSGSRVPVIYSSIPARPTPKSLTTSVLTALGADDPAYGSSDDQLRRFVRLAKACQVELLLIDEIHHFVDRGRTASHAAAADRLKELVDAVRKPCVLCGAPRASSLFLINNQLRNRFMTSLRLRPFSLSTEGRPAYLGFVKAAGMTLPEQLRKLVFAQGFANRLWYATDGLPRQLVDLLRHLRDAVAAGAKPELATAKTVFEHWIWADVRDVDNPFSLAFSERRLNAPGEPYEPSLLDGDNHA